MNHRAVPARIGMLGVDLNTPLTARDATALAAHGYSFVLRYVPRLVQHPNDLTGAEFDTIRAAGLGLMIVQHVESEGAWTPTRAKGAAYGACAAKRSIALGVAPQTVVWLDLEGVAPDVPHGEVITYCNTWHDAVVSAGFTPGLYVGWHCGLTANELYHALWFRHYWASYNLNADEYPAIRGVQMRQRAPTHDDYPAGFPAAFDVNLVTGDQLGGLPVMDVPNVYLPG
jgi:hypothetical protein